VSKKKLTGPDATIRFNTIYSFFQKMKVTRKNLNKNSSGIAMTPFKLKELLAKSLYSLGILQALIKLQSKSPGIRIVNYHDVPATFGFQLEQQLQWFSTFFAPACPGDLDRLLYKGGLASGGKLKLLMTFDDGYVSSYNVVAPLLEKYGFRGFFFIPAKVLDLPEQDQKTWANEHSIYPLGNNERAQVFMNLSQVNDLHARGHHVGVHGMNHARLTSELTKQELTEEIITSRAILADRLGFAPASFAWIGGEKWAYSENAANYLSKQKYQFIFATNNAIIRESSDPQCLDRTNLEAHFSKEVTFFQLSGIMDLLYLRKRKAVHILTCRKEG